MLPEAHPDARAISDWVVRHAATLRLQADSSDPRGVRLARAWHDDALVVAPLRGPEGVTGTLALARRGPGARFDDTELELIQLFAGHVSIALQNAGAHQAAEMRAQTDSLTGLKNQGTFREHMAFWVARGMPFSLLIMDLDGFKAFNDESGHEAGNALLAHIADSLRTVCRDTDEVFRYGGDEFALILPGTEGAGALEVAARIGRAVRGLGADDRGSKGISCSVGVATFPVDAPDQAGLIMAADRALLRRQESRPRPDRDRAGRPGLRGGPRVGSRGGVRHRSRPAGERGPGARRRHCTRRQQRLTPTVTSVPPDLVPVSIMHRWDVRQRPGQRRQAAACGARSACVSTRRSIPSASHAGNARHGSIRSMVPRIPWMHG